MRTAFILCVLLMPIMVTLPCFADHESLSITFVSPHSSDNQFWGTAHDFARNSARDLNIKLTILYNRGNNRFSYLKSFEKAVNASRKPDLIIGIFYRFIGTRLLEMAKNKDIPVFMINTNIPDDEKAKIGSPRERFENFIGHMAPDEKAAGDLLARYLIKKARIRFPGNQIQIAGLSGHRGSPVSLNRSLGLKNGAAAENAVLRQLIFSDWNKPHDQVKQDVITQTKVLLKRYPNLTALWYVCDWMAMAGKTVMGQMDKEIITGGIDWEKEAVFAVKNGLLDASMGGHFTELGFSLVLVHDYLHGRDFHDDPGTGIKTKMTLLTQENIDRFYMFLMNRNWEAIDFKSYSKILNPELKTYDFSFKTLLTRTKE